MVQDELILSAALGQFQASLFRQFGGLEPSANRHLLMCRTITDGISLNFTRFCSEERDALLLDAMAQPDPSTRVANWQAISQDINDAFTHVFLLHTIWDNAFDESVRGVCDRTSTDGIALQCAVNGRTWFDSVWISD